MVWLQAYFCGWFALYRQDKKIQQCCCGTGHAMLGLSLGAGTGKLVSELVDEKKTSIDLKAFEVERFG